VLITGEPHAPRHGRTSTHHNPIAQMRVDGDASPYFPNSRRGEASCRAVWCCVEDVLPKSPECARPRAQNVKKQAAHS